MRSAPFAVPSRRAPRAPRRRRSLAALLALGLLPALAACGSLQISKLRTEQSVIDGSNAQVGDMLVRYAYIPTPEGQAYDKGESAPLAVTFVNTSDDEDAFIGASTEAARAVRLHTDDEGDVPMTGGRTLERIEIPAGGKVAGRSFVLTLTGLTRPLPSAVFVPVTFRFARAGSVTVHVPVQTPASPAPRSGPVDDGAEH